jgi:hypothetical protein
MASVFPLDIELLVALEVEPDGVGLRIHGLIVRTGDSPGRFAAQETRNPRKKRAEPRAAPSAFQHDRAIHAPAANVAVKRFIRPQGAAHQIFLSSE